ncbi:hypothetical protein EYF80_013658 [Liparis tanakae]|uniref:Uncharacterized protein n=1 Tax=Liparis tanakae TaxID=230148 RepID=A0A4Z2IDZ7_9TELE|nr:hypothetical protein EYF80_013658 [Liparis tanakae]
MQDMKPMITMLTMETSVRLMPRHFFRRWSRYLTKVLIRSPTLWNMTKGELRACQSLSAAGGSLSRCGDDWSGSGARQQQTQELEATALPPPLTRSSDKVIMRQDVSTACAGTQGNAVRATRSVYMDYSHCHWQRKSAASPLSKAHSASQQAVSTAPFHPQLRLAKDIITPPDALSSTTFSSFSKSSGDRLKVSSSFAFFRSWSVLWVVSSRDSSASKIAAPTIR